MDFHRFRFVDDVLAYDKRAGTLTATCYVPPDLDVFAVHFPGHPVLPGVLAAEMMNQAAGLLLWDAMDRARLPYFCQAKALRLRAFIRPAETAEIHANLVHLGSGYAVTQARVLCGSVLAADAEIMFRTIAFPTPEFSASFAREGAALLDRRHGDA